MIDLYGYVTVLCLFVSFFRLKIKASIPSMIVMVFTINTIIMCLLDESDVSRLMIVTMPLLISYGGWYSFLRELSFVKLFEIWEIYLKLSLIIGFLAIFQYISYTLFGQVIFDPFWAGVTATAYEKSHLVVLLAPATTYYFLQKRILSFANVVLLSVMILTNSLTGFVVLIFVLLIRLMKSNFVGAILLIPIFVSIPFLLTEDILFRLNGLKEFLSTDIDFSIYNNLSVLSAKSNFRVALNNVNRNWILGGGFGSHSSIYTDTFRHLGNQTWYGINSISGHSLFIRILSEMGIFGIVGYTLLVLNGVKVFLNSKGVSSAHSLVLISIASHFVAKTVKVGGYIDYGTPFLLCLYIVIMTQPRS